MCRKTKKTAVPGRRRGTAVHVTATQGGGESSRSECAVPATPGRRREAAGLAITDPGRRRGPVHLVRSVNPAPGIGATTSGRRRDAVALHRRPREEERAV